MPAARRFLVPALALVGAVGAAACGSSNEPDAGADGGPPTVVVTYSILGDVVRQLVGDAAAVQVIIPDGQDPHDYEPSAKDVETIRRASLLVVNGFDLEEGLAGVIDQARADGVDVFVATDHVTLRELGAGAPDAHGEDGHGGEDPHIWTDPTMFVELAPDLTAELERVLDVSLDTRLVAFEAAMGGLDEEVRSIMGAIPPGECRLVTGHESLGYFADRYGCTLVGAVIPSLSSSAETSARALAELHELAEAAGVRAIFTEVGSPSQIAEQVADEVGVPLVELPSHDLPDDGGYAAFLIDLANRIAAALAP